MRRVAAVAALLLGLLAFSSATASAEAPLRVTGQITDPAGALEICERHPGPIHLLMTDVVMPEMSGRDLGERVRASHARIRVLYMSGYTDDAVVLHGVLTEAMAFLQKPFTSEALARKVRELVDATKSGS